MNTQKKYYVLKNPLKNKNKYCPFNKKESSYESSLREHFKAWNNNSLFKANNHFFPPVPPVNCNYGGLEFDDGDVSQEPEDLDSSLDQSSDDILLNAEFDGETGFFEGESGEALIQKEGKEGKNELRLDVEVSIDSEYTADSNLSLQVVCRYQINKKPQELKAIVVNSKFTERFSQEIIQEMTDTGVFIDFADLDNPKTQPLVDILISFISFKHEIQLQNYTKITFNVTLYLFYAVRDLTIAFGLDRMLPIYQNKSGRLNSYRGLRGFFKFNSTLSAGVNAFFNIYVKDLCCLDNGSLKDIAASCGISVEKKTILDDYKTNMILAIQNKPLEFLQYGLNDAVLLFQILESKLQSFNSILLDVYGVESVFTKQNFPLTVGSIVYEVWRRFFEKYMFNNDVIKQLAFAKQGVLNQNSRNYTSNLEQFKILSEFGSYEQALEYCESDLQKEMNLLSLLSDKEKIFKYSLINYASINNLLEGRDNSNAYLLSLRMGGRTNNEIPHEYFFEFGADIDLQSAYASGLLKCTYPVGRPNIWSKTFNDSKKLTLGNFFRRYSDQLIPFTWHVVVNGKLTFNQDLVYSKLIKENLAKSKIENFSLDNPEKNEVEGNLVLLRKEIINGVITSTLWELIEKTCSNSEKSEFLELEVVASIFYLKKDMVLDKEEFLKILFEDRQKYTYNRKFATVEDRRTKKWFPLPIKDFIYPLLKKRLALKEKLKTNPNALDEAEQTSLKLIMNTFYGITSSVFFPVNNVVIANNLTAMVRGYVWLLNKALNTRLSITDGGPYELQKVNFLKSNRKPGMDTLSDLSRLQKHRSIEVGSLGAVDWSPLFHNNVDPKIFPFDVDKLATQHLKDFWEPYGINIDFKIEHKLNNMALRASYFLKAHYMFLTWNKETGKYDYLFTKIRGLRTADKLNPNAKKNPMFYLMQAMINEQDAFSFEYEFEDTSLLSLRQYRDSLVENDGVMTSRFGKLPGDEIVKRRSFRLNNTHVFLYTAKEYNTRNRRSLNTTKDENGLKTRKFLFEKYLEPYGIRRTVDLMVDDNLRVRP